MVICILGRQPALGLADLEATFGAASVRPLSTCAARVNVPNLDLSRFGGTIKSTRELAVVDTTDFNRLLTHCRDIVRELAQKLPEGKVKIGLSLYGFDLSPEKIS